MELLKQVVIFMLCHETISLEINSYFFTKSAIHGGEIAFANDTEPVAVGTTVQCALECGAQTSQICPAFQLSASFQDGSRLCTFLTQGVDPYRDDFHYVDGYSVYEQIEMNQIGLISPGLSQDAAVRTCQDLPSEVVSGTYWIDPDGGSHDNAFRVFCDMVTDGGGWTLVYRYTFTSYEPFDQVGNAVTPRPNWITPLATTPVSTDPPAKEHDLGAVDFALWSQIGSKVLIKSNLAHWVKCQDDTGSFVNWRPGTMTCSIVKSISVMDGCRAIPTPSVAFSYDNHGPHISASGHSLMYYWDGDENNNWPTHDPCSRNEPNQVPNLKSPSGGIYLKS